MKTILKSAAALSVAVLAFGGAPAAFAGDGDNPVAQQRAKLKAEWAKARADKGEQQAGFTLFGLLSDDTAEVAEQPVKAPKSTN